MAAARMLQLLGLLGVGVGLGVAVGLGKGLNVVVGIGVGDDVEVGAGTGVGDGVAPWAGCRPPRQRATTATAAENFVFAPLI